MATVDLTTSKYPGNYGEARQPYLDQEVTLRRIIDAAALVTAGLTFSASNIYKAIAYAAGSLITFAQIACKTAQGEAATITLYDDVSQTTALVSASDVNTLYAVGTTYNTCKYKVSAGHICFIPSMVLTLAKFEIIVKIIPPAPTNYTAAD